MRTDGNLPSDTALLEHELAELAKLAIPPMTPARQRDGFAAVSARLARLRQRNWLLRPSRLGLALCGATVVALVGAGWLGLRAGKPRAAAALAYRAELGEILDGGYLRAFADRGMRLRFSEGSRLDLLPGAHGRLRQVDDGGARIAIEDGPAHIDVTQRPGAHWLIDAGPFLITVKGTSFTVAWDAKAEQLDLRMERGVVAVTGPILENVMTVRGGQRLAINLPRKEVVLHDLDGGQPDQLPSLAAGAPAGHATTGDEPAESKLERAAAPTVAATSPGTTLRVAHRPRVAGAYGWAPLLAAGDVDTILGDVERVGLKRSLAEASSDDLSALADAARYRRQEDLARQALLAQRARFAGTSRACDAAFLLGRLEESHEGRGLKALEWYDQYLEGAPTGAYASEALGRKMMATQKLMGSAAARAVAQEYLARFPTGSYAGAARALRQAP